MKLIFRKKTLALIIPLLLVSILCLTTLGTTHEVSKSDDQFGSIQAAIDYTEPGDTVLVGEGTYEENLSVDKDLTLKGVGASSVTIEGQEEGYPVIHLGPSKVELTVRALTLQEVKGDSCKNKGRGFCPDGITAVGKSELKVKRVSISEKGNTGIRLWDSAEATVVNSEIRDNDDGIWLEDSTQATVKNSEISGNRWTGIWLEDSAQAIILNNLIRRNKVGIEIKDPRKFKDALEGSGNRIMDNNKDFEGVSESTREKLVS